MTTQEQGRFERKVQVTLFAAIVLAALFGSAWATIAITRGAACAQQRSGQ